MSVLAFDIETVPDVAGGRRLYGLDGLPDADVMRAMRQLRRQKVGHDFLAPHLHRVVAISCVLATSDGVRVWSLGRADSPEGELIRRFYDGLERYRPTLVSWNGSGFDLPVLSYRALRHGIPARMYWELGDEDSTFRFNNYVSRYHWRHVDLMDVLAHFQPRGAVPLDEMARLLGLPGKAGMDGSEVADAWLAGETDAIRAYCETDVLNTYLLWLRFQLVRGRLDADAYDEQLRSLRDLLLADAERPHLVEFAENWEP